MLIIFHSFQIQSFFQLIHQEEVFQKLSAILVQLQLPSLSFSFLTQLPLSGVQLLPSFPLEPLTVSLLQNPSSFLVFPPFSPLQPLLELLLISCSFLKHLLFFLPQSLLLHLLVQRLLISCSFLIHQWLFLLQLMSLLVFLLLSEHLLTLILHVFLVLLPLLRRLQATLPLLVFQPLFQRFSSFLIQALAQQYLLASHREQISFLTFQDFNPLLYVQV